MAKRLVLSLTLGSICGLITSLIIWFDQVSAAALLPEDQEVNAFTLYAKAAFGGHCVAFATSFTAFFLCDIRAKLQSKRPWLGLKVILTRTGSLRG